MESGSINPTLLRSSTVADAMGSVALVLANTPVNVAAKHLQESRGRALVVDTGDDSPSICTDYDIVKMIAAGESPEGKTVADFHTRTAVAAKPTWSLERALHTMMVGRFRHLVVVDEDQIVGLLSMPDILEVVVEHNDEPEAVGAGETVEIASVVPDDSARLLHDLRRGAKQHPQRLLIWGSANKELAVTPVHSEFEATLAANNAWGLDAPRLTFFF